MNRCRSQPDDCTPTGMEGRRGVCSRCTIRIEPRRYGLRVSGFEITRFVDGDDRCTGGSVRRAAMPEPATKRDGRPELSSVYAVSNC
jgi:hypothetical protein